MQKPAGSRETLPVLCFFEYFLRWHSCIFCSGAFFFWCNDCGTLGPEEADLCFSVQKSLRCRNWQNFRIKQPGKTACGKPSSANQEKWSVNGRKIGAIFSFAIGTARFFPSNTVGNANSGRTRQLDPPYFRSKSEDFRPKVLIFPRLAELQRMAL